VETGGPLLAGQFSRALRLDGRRGAGADGANEKREKVPGRSNLGGRQKS